MRRTLILAAVVLSPGFLLAEWSLAQAAAPAPEENGKTTVEKSTFGRMPDGTQVDLYTLTNAAGMEVKVMTYGATLISVKVPDRDGKLDNVTLYLDTFEHYRRGHPLFGSVVGRYANRVAGAKFTLDGVEHRITPNAGKHHIHGGRKGFQKTVWKAKPVRGADGVGVELSHTSPDGHEGYPGTLSVTVTYTLSRDNWLTMEYTARTDKPTHVNLTNHAYWNLAGAGSGDVLGHVLMLNADRYLPADEKKIPSGELKSVKGTVMDFTAPKTIGSRIERVEGKNYDHCYVLNKKPGEPLSLCASVVDPKSGRVMEVLTTQPGVQLYTAKWLGSRLSGGGKPYGPYHGVCLETQHYPNAPNQPEFPSTVLRPGQTYRQVTIHKFSVRKKGDKSNLPGHRPEVARGPEGASHKLDSSPFSGRERLRAMKRLLPAICLVLLPAPAASPGAGEFQLEKGFVRLDNGKDLAGWTGNHGEWSVADGAIHLDFKARRGGSILYSERTHTRNAIVRLQYRASRGADSGVFLHGAQFQVRDYENSLPDTKKYAPFAKPAGQWNDLEFDVTGGVAVVKLNGQVIHKSWRIGGKAGQGIGLQKEKGDFDFRYVRLKEKK